MAKKNKRKPKRKVSKASLPNRGKRTPAKVGEKPKTWKGAYSKRGKGKKQLPPGLKTTEVRKGGQSFTPGVTSVRPGVLVDNYAWTRTPIANTAWNSANYLLQRQAYMDFVTNVAVYRAEFASAFWASSSHELVKDWDATQQQHYEELVFYAADYLCGMGAQAIERGFCKVITEDDTTPHWTEESWVSHKAALISHKVMVPAVSVALAKSICRYTVLNPGWPQKNLPPMVYMPFRPSYTVITARAAVTEMRTRTPGAMIHALKAHLTMVPLTAELIDSLVGAYSTNGDEGVFWAYTQKFIVDKGGSEETMDAERLEAGGLPIIAGGANMTTDYTSINLYFLGLAPPDIWCLTKILQPYQAVNNKTGALVLDAVADDLIGLSHIAVDDLVFTPLQYPTDMYLIGIVAAMSLNKTIKFETTDANVAGEGVFYPSFTFLGGKPAFKKTSIPYLEWVDFEIRFIETYSKVEFTPVLLEENPR